MSWAKPTIRYCEANLHGLVAEPANAASSLLISAAGLYILRAKHHCYAVPLGGVAVVLGLASFFYYASFTFAGQLADLGSMYLLASLVMIVGMRSFKLSNKISLAVLVLVTTVLLIVTAVAKTIAGFNVGIPLFAILLSIAAFFELRTAQAENFQLKYLGLALVALLLGFIFWWLDYKKIWCSAGSAHYINGHALWHLSNAAALLLLDRYYSQLS